MVQKCHMSCFCQASITYGSPNPAFLCSASAIIRPLCRCSQIIQADSCRAVLTLTRPLDAANTIANSHCEAACRELILFLFVRATAWKHVSRSACWQPLLHACMHACVHVRHTAATMTAGDPSGGLWASSPPRVFLADVQLRQRAVFHELWWRWVGSGGGVYAGIAKADT